MAERPSLLAHLATRGALRGFVAVAAVIARLFADPPPEPTPAGLAGLLGDAAGARVEVESIAWEPARSVLAELVFGRRVLFLAAPKGGPKDVYRAAVRLAPGGQPLAVGRIDNLTRTAQADELGLMLEGGVATFASVAFERVQAMTILELRGAEVARTDVLLEPPVVETTLSRSGHSLTLRIPPDDHELVIDASRPRVVSEPSLARAIVRVPAPRPIATAVADAAEHWLGSELSDALAHAWWGGCDLVRRATYAVTHVGRRPEPRPGDTPRAPVESARRAQRSEDVWPPPSIPSIWTSPEPAQARFAPLRTRGDGEALLQRAVIHPDPARPYARAVVVAMDMRRLELGIHAGSEFPRASTGPPGEGRLAVDPAKNERVVAVFNGGRCSRSEGFGMLAEARLLAPPEPGATTVAALARGGAALGTWPFELEVPSSIVAFRQGMNALFDAEARARRAHEQAAAAVRTRSGLCVTPAGHLYYAFGEELDERALANAFVQAGCAYAVELAGGAEPTGISLAEPGSGASRFTTLEPSMTFDAEGVPKPSARDFFSVKLRRLEPPVLERAAFAPDGAAQPPPERVPGIFRAEVPIGALAVEVIAFEAGRVEWRLRPGVREPGAKGEPWAGFLPEGDAGRALAVLELGHTTVRPRLGLALGGTAPIALKESFATVVLRPTEPPRLFVPGERAALGPDDQAVQLPLLADGDGITERARERGDFRKRAALGVSRSGRVLVALLEHDSSDPLAVALRETGAERVVELDRGSRHPAFVHRRGGTAPIAATYDTSTLWALTRPMLPGARIGFP